MKKLLLDTDVWLGLVEDHRRTALLDVIEEMLRRNLVDIIVPETVVEEFKFERKSVSIRISKELANAIKGVREALPRISADPKTRSAAMEHLLDAGQRVHNVGAGIESTLDRIQRLLERRRFDLGNHVYQRAGKRIRERRAPCHKKPEFTDAMNIEAYADLIQHRDSDTDCGFVTYNIIDFSKDRADNRIPHDDIASLFDGINSRYFVDLAEALRFVDAELTEKTTERDDPTVGHLL
jgi:hypothetical protein